MQSADTENLLFGVDKHQLDFTLLYAVSAPAMLCHCAAADVQAKGVAGLLSSSPSQWQVLQPSSELSVDPGYLSEPVSIEFPTDGGLTAFMNYYPPRNKDYSFHKGELPALVSSSCCLSMRLHAGRHGVGLTAAAVQLPASNSASVTCVAAHEFIVVVVSLQLHIPCRPVCCRVS